MITTVYRKRFITTSWFAVSTATSMTTSFVSNIAAAATQPPARNSSGAASATGNANSTRRTNQDDTAGAGDDATNGEAMEARTSGASALSPEVVQFGKLTGILPLLDQLHSEQERIKVSGSKDPAVRALELQKLIYIRAKATTYLQAANLELNSVVGKLNSGMAEIADRQASISDARARMLRRNTFINLISGGVTKVGGYTSALTPASLIPTNVLEIFDGGVQIGLSASTIKQQRAESKIGRSRPVILTTFLHGTNASTQIFPKNVWNYLNEKDPHLKNNRSRRETLISYWFKIGRLTQRNNNSNTSGRPKEVAGVRMPMNDLDDMVAMMSDLKSLVEEMEEGLLKVAEVLKASYENDPEL